MDFVAKMILKVENNDFIGFSMLKSVENDSLFINIADLATEILAIVVFKMAMSAILDLRLWQSMPSKSRGA